MVLRQSGFSKELHRGTPSTGLCHVVRVWILETSEPLFLKVPVLPRMLILICSRHVATPYGCFLQIFLERAPEQAYPSQTLELSFRINFSCCAPHWVPVVA